MAKPTIETLPQGFVAGGIGSGIKPRGKLDLGIIYCDRPTVAVGVLTTNQFPAAPVRLCRPRLQNGHAIQGVVVNSANANAIVDQGLKDALAMARSAEKALGVPEESFLVASTGVIGKRIDLKKIRPAIKSLAGQLSPDGFGRFARAIMTTDTHPKLCRKEIKMANGEMATLVGAAKGVGMIEPNMATMLAFVLTDYPMSRYYARAWLRKAADVSFNCLTIDAQMSTNDMALLLGSRILKRGGLTHPKSNRDFSEALVELCQDLARQMASDGEGATKLITVEVTGAATKREARMVGKEVANSNLVKTAIFGELPNWGRIAQAIGQTKIKLDPEAVSIKLQKIELLRRGRPRQVDRAALRRRLKTKEVLIQIDLGRGDREARIWTCDLTHGYVKINTEYN